MKKSGLKFIREKIMNNISINDIEDDLSFEIPISEILGLLEMARLIEEKDIKFSSDEIDNAYRKMNLGNDENDPIYQAQKLGFIQGVKWLSDKLNYEK